MRYQWVRQKTYWLESPKEAVRQLYYEAEVVPIDERLSVKISISKNEYRHFMRYNELSENLHRILTFFYCHRIKKLPKLNGGKGSEFRYFGAVGNLNLDSVPFSELSLVEQIEQIIKIKPSEGSKPKPETALFINLKTAYGLFWVSLTKNGYKRLCMHLYNDRHIEQIRTEAESLIKSQIANRTALIESHLR
jgi:hypothetical protein